MVHLSRVEMVLQFDAGICRICPCPGAIRGEDPEDEDWVEYLDISVIVDSTMSIERSIYVVVHM